jgi:hypothetical protein
MIINALYPNIWRIISRAIVQISGQYGGRVFFNAAPPESPYPYLIYEGDSSFGYSFSLLNASAWKGIITMRSISNTLAGASDSLAELSNGFPGPFVVSGIANIAVPYDVQFYPYKIYTFPIERFNSTAVYTAAIGVETFITPT